MSDGAPVGGVVADVGNARRTRFRQAAASFIFFFAMAIVAPVVPTYVVQAFGSGGVGVGLAVAAMSLPGVVIRPFAGGVVDRRGPGAGLAIGAACGIAAFAGLAVAPLLVMFIGFRVLLGFADGFCMVGSARAFDDGRRGRGTAYTRFAAVFVAGTAVGPIAAAGIVHAAGAGAVFWTAAVATGVAWLMLGEVGTTSRRMRVAMPPTAAARTTIVTPVVLGGLALGFANLGFGAVYGFAVLRGAALGMRVPELLLSAFSLTLLVGRVAGASLPDRFGLGRTITWMTLLSAAGLFLASVAATPWLLAVAMLVVGLGYAFVMPAVLAEAATVAGEAAAGAAVGTVMGLLDLVLALGTAGLGVVATAFGPAATMTASGVAALAALPLFTWWRARSGVVQAEGAA